MLPVGLTMSLAELEKSLLGTQERYGPIIGSALSSQFADGPQTRPLSMQGGKYNFHQY